MADGSNDEGQVGYRHPPSATRFRKGQSGNSRGRPKGRKRQLPYEAVLGQLVTINEGGVERRVTAAEAFLLYMTKEGLKGKGVAGRATLAALERASAAGWTEDRNAIRLIVRIVMAESRVCSALESLRMARTLDRYRDTAKMMLEPWLVEMALARLGNRQLTPDEQKQVINVTRTPRKMKWPSWW